MSLAWKEITSTKSRLGVGAFSFVTSHKISYTYIYIYIVMRGEAKKKQVLLSCQQTLHALTPTGTRSQSGLCTEYIKGTLNNIKSLSFFLNNPSCLSLSLSLSLYQSCSLSPSLSLSLSLSLSHTHTLTHTYITVWCWCWFYGMSTFDR